MRLTSLPFDEWVRHVFDHPGDGPEWYFGLEAPFWDGPPAVTLDYLARLFGEPRPTLDVYSDAQLNRGLWYLLGSSGHNFPEVLGDPRLPEEARVACLEAMPTFFREVFAERCTPTLSHLDEPGASALNLACYMWWDIIAFFAAPDVPERRAVDHAALEVMRRTLELPHVACQENALHGLGHWYLRYPAPVEAIIDRFLTANPDARPELLAYARAARTGCVL